MSLSNRLRPGVEAAPWVCEEVVNLEAELDATNRQVEILSDVLAESRREIDAMVALARADEREACAKVCESNVWGKDVAWWQEATKSEVSVESSIHCAAAIRARSCPPCNNDCDQGRNCPARKDK